MTKLGRLLKNYRKKEGISQRILAQKLEVTNQTVNNIELGKTITLSHSLFTAITETFGIDSQALIDLINEDQKTLLKIKYSKDF